MIKRELKINFKSFFIWLLVLILIFLLVYLMYPSIMNSESSQMIDEMMKIFPEEVLKAFNMDLASMDSAFGWLKTEGFIFVLLIVGSYSAILGGNIILKEESDKTIEYLNSLPITRTKIVCSKTLVGLIYIISMIVIFGVFNYIGLSITGEFDKTQFILLSITPLFTALVMYFGCMFLATFTHKTKKMFGVSLGITLTSYVFQILSTIAKETEFLKYFSAFTLADIRKVITDSAINPVMPVISLSLSVVFFILTLACYNKKELV